MRDPDFTLSAGPTMAWPQVLAAQGKQITYHYDPVFLEAFRRTEHKVAEIFLTKNDVLLMQGEAVLGLEAAARGLVRPGTPVLNLVSGIFGKGMGYWLKDFGAELHELEVPYNDSVDPAEVERYLEEHPEIELVTVVHSETPSGTLHDLAAIGPMARAHGAMTLVDCVSSLGCIEFRTDDWQTTRVAAAQKCLGGPPGR
jgi:pyridoxamine--pyruvate transaminase